MNIIQSECCACEEAKYEIMFQVSLEQINKYCRSTFYQLVVILHFTNNKLQKMLLIRNSYCRVL